MTMTSFEYCVWDVNDREELLGGKADAEFEL